MQNLDIQYTVGVATGVPTVFISVGDTNHDGVAGFLDVVNFLVDESDSDLPHVLSTSYGFDEEVFPDVLLGFVILLFMRS